MKINTKQMVLIALFTALTAIGGFLSIPIGNVPISLQSLFTILSGLILGAKFGCLSQLLYVFLGLIGMRIFSGFSGGPSTVFSPSFGYLLGFIFASYVVGKIGYSHSFKRMFLATVVGTISIYICGVPYLYFILNKVLLKGISWSVAFKTGCLVFLPGDLLKCFVSTYVAYKIIPILKLTNKQYQ